MLTTRRALIGGALACSISPRSLSAAAPVNDIAILRDAYTAMHPGLYRYASPAQVEARLVALDRAFQRSDDLSARYLALSRFAATVRCGHTYANFYNQSDAVQAQLFGRRNRLPFTFRWIGGRMIVTDAGAMPRGSEVLRIDGHPAPAILKALVPLVRADGGNDAKRVALLGVEARDDWESFDIYYPLLFPAGDRFRLDVRLPDGKRRTLILDAFDLAQRRAQRPPEHADFGWTIEHHGRTAIVTMPDWGVYDAKWNWGAWIDAAMDEIAARASTGLIVDLRANEGGKDCGDEIIARLIDSELTEAGARRRVRFRTAPEHLLPYLDTWDPSFRTLGKDSIDRGDGFLDLPTEDTTRIAPKGPRFRGRVLVLVGPQNSSATFHFASRIRQNRLGTLIGSPTGGNRRGINGGAYFFLRLPGGLEVDLPLVGYFPDRPQPDAGLMPDIAEADTPANIAAGRDRVLDRALALLA